MVSSYAPTLAAICNARRNFQAIPRHGSRALLVAIPNTNVGNKPPLPHATAELEEIRQIIPRQHILQLPQTPDPNMVTQTLIDALPAASILHFAGHGQQNIKQPMNSGFLMQDGVLTLATLMGLKLPNAFLAFLSACESAKGDPDEPDQVSHLAAAMLFTGFRSVVATMWSVLFIGGLSVSQIMAL